MSGPSAYVTVVRTVFGVIFLAGAAVHTGFALTDPSFYADFGITAWPPLDRIWVNFVMPNIVGLAGLQAFIELAVGIAAWLPGRWNRASVIAMTAFFVFLVPLGFAFPTTSWWQDLLVNRLASLVMIALVLPWLVRHQQRSVPRAWRDLVRRGAPVRPSSR